MNNQILSANLSKYLLWFTVITAGMLVQSFNALAKDSQKGLEIATEVKHRDMGWQDTNADMQMILRGPTGDESVREIRVATLEVEGDGDKSLTIFDLPKDVAGTAFLSFSKTNGADDQWIYLPALKRVKRISTRNKSSPFMGSEFAYEDMTSFELEKFSFAYLRDENLNGLDCFVVEQIPTDKYSGYTKQIVWVDKAHYRMQRTEFYDRKGALLKVLEPSDYQLHLDKFWRAHQLDMVNVQSDKSTTLVIDNISFKTGLTDKYFTKNALQRLR